MKFLQKLIAIFTKERKTRVAKTNEHALCELFGIGRLTISSAEFLNNKGYAVTLKHDAPVIEIEPIEEDDFWQEYMKNMEDGINE